MILNPTKTRGGHAMLNLVLDFDGTMADTFAPSPSGIGVNEAYRLAVNCLFGKIGEMMFDNIGGLQNRAPIELIEILQKRGVKLSVSLEEAAEKLVCAKLDALTGEIGTTWPLPCQGYTEFNAGLFRLCQDGLDIHLAVLSSGHTEFIKKTLAVWDKQWKVFWPDIIISDDDVRHLPLPIEQKIKPSPFLFKLIKERMSGKFFYFGDDPEKDGRLALNSGVPFGWFMGNKDEKKMPGDVTPFIIFNDWKEVTKLFS